MKWFRMETGWPKVRACAAVCLFLTLSWLTAGCGRAPDLETAQMFQDAESAFAAAQSESEFAQVAARYDRLLDRGFVSGVALYNQGNAWMRAGEAGRAIAAWRQAQRYQPRNPYLAASLQSVLTACQSSASVAPDSGIAGYVFFWQDWLSYPEKYLLTTLLVVTATLLGLLTPLVKQRRLLRRLTLLTGALCLVSVISAVRDWHRFEQTVHGVVVVETVEARKGNSDSYEVAFTNPLREGTEFTVLEERADWFNISIQDLGTAWIPADSVVVY